MPSYHFPAEAGEALPDTRPETFGPEAIAALLDRLGLAHDGVRITRQGDTVTLEGRVADAAAEELLVLATGNLAGIGQVRDQLTTGHAPGLLDSLGAFARLPAGSASTEAAETAVHAAQPEAGTRFGPAGSLFHAMQPGESLADLAARHYGDPAAGERRLLEANAAILRNAGSPGPGLVLRIPPK
ncbi:MAG: hypothetical protein EON47_17490 [Acetobacteraceae bacterium]|nr:MAG: hypothetical protein EON47_17490 [Acetobacteraceae bacterium]